MKKSFIITKSRSKSSQSSINNVKLPHDACLISRVNCRISFPRRDSASAEYSLIYLNLHTHVSLALPRHNLHVSAYVLSFGSVIYDLAAFETLFGISTSDKRTKFESLTMILDIVVGSGGKRDFKLIWKI